MTKSNIRFTFGLFTQRCYQSRHNRTTLGACTPPSRTTLRYLFLNILLNTWLERIHHYQLTWNGMCSSCYFCDEIFVPRFVLFTNSKPQNESQFAVDYTNFPSVRRSIMIKQKLFNQIIKQFSIFIPYFDRFCKPSWEGLLKTSPGPIQTLNL